ncbi:winged helix-turn-helix domain-containing protein [Candidatus Zixiibacteriota bacterium]
MHNELGTTAGDIYQKLNAQGQMSMSRLKKEIARNDVMVTMAVGWLAREGKVSLSKERHALKIALNGH